MQKRDFFPWIHSPRGRIGLFREEIVRADEGYDYISAHYKRTVENAPCLDCDSREDKAARVACCLSVEYFMTNLLARKDRMSMAHGLEVRVPFADHRILEYIYNVPWSVKFEGGVEKALLRNAMSGFLPKRILERKKSPYPKTQSPEYEAIVLRMLERVLSKKDSTLSSLLDRERLSSSLALSDATWYGQLMARPQLIAWLIELDAWLEHYKVEVIL
jgi:asparagine synthase (glutamine-hydrolysing)